MNEECVREWRIRKKMKKKFKMHDQNQNHRTPD